MHTFFNFVQFTKLTPFNERGCYMMTFNDIALPRDFYENWNNKDSNKNIHCNNAKRSIPEHPTFDYDVPRYLHL